jgi:hypothetical protein
VAIRRDWDVLFDVDDVLRSQGADPAVVRARRPQLVALAEEAIDFAADLIDPAVLTTTVEVTAVRHNRVALEGGAALTGSLITEHFGGADRVAVMLCTIGGGLDEAVRRVSPDNLSLALALDAAGSAAVHALSAAACNEVEGEAAAAGLRTSLPLSPGLEGWDVGTGQREIFSIIDPALVGVTVSSGMEMRPLKSETIAVGIGADMVIKGAICDYCDMRDTCRHRIP